MVAEASEPELFRRTCVGPDGRIAADMPCLHCGYNLRSLLSDGTCPECGQPVADSAPLRFSDVTWLRRLPVGAFLLACSIIGAAVAPSMTPAIGEAVFGPRKYSLPQAVGQTVLPPSPWPGRIEWLIVHTPFAAGFAAVLLLTAPRRFEPRKRQIRGRSLVIVLAPILPVWLVVSGTKQLQGWDAAVGWIVAEPMCYAGMLGFALATLHYLSELGRCPPRSTLARLARVLTWVAVPLGLAWLAMEVAGAVATIQLSDGMSAPMAQSMPVFSSTAPGTATGTLYMIFDKSDAVTLTTTAPADALRRFERLMRPTRWDFRFWLDCYSVIRRYLLIPAGVWFGAAVVQLVGLWWKLHVALKERLGLERPRVP